MPMTEREPSGRRPPEILINYTEPRVKPPPLLEVGALAWIRKNLLGSWLDVLLTVFGVVVIVSFVVGLIQWIIQDGNWFAVMFSLRTFTVGRLDLSLIPRVNGALLFVMFAIGATTAAYTRRVAPIIPALFVIIAGALLFLPMIINAMIVPPPHYLTAGNTEIASGTAKEDPIEQLAFVARQGETISVRVANDAGFEDRLATTNGLVDRSTNTLRNAAINRITAMARQKELLSILTYDSQIAGGTEMRSDELTPNRRAQLIDEFIRLSSPLSDDLQAQLKTIDEALTKVELTDDQRTAQVIKKEQLLVKSVPLIAPPAITETYHINLLPAQIAFYDGEGNELQAPQTIDANGEVTFTVPADGWYVLEKTVPGDAPGLTVLAVQGVYPLFQISDRYVRVLDNFEWLSAPPKDMKWVTLLENRYRGSRPADEFLRLYVSPFLEKIRETVLKSMMAIVIGFFAARLLDQSLSPLAQPHKESRRLANWMLIATPFVVFLLINGIDTLALMSALSWMVGLYWAYHLGTWVYEPFSKRGFLPVPLVRVGLFLVVAGIAYLMIHYVPSLLYNAEPTNIAISILLAFPVGLMFFVGLVSGTGEEYRVVNQRVISVGILVGVLFFLPIIIARVFPPDMANTIKNVLPYTDSNTWGGLLLSLLVTLYGIIFAFPIGILLALGRRSKLPAIRYPSTFIIETVRGTPFIVVLFAGQFLITFLHPSFQNIPSAYRALASTIIFVAAYLAENIRGGLQAIPNGQYEAGRALGLPEWQITLQITLPQALRAVIPALVGMFISLFKDTSLLEIVSLSDLTRGVSLMVAQAEFRESRQEGLIFITLIYFTISYVMAFVSRRIEESGAGAARRI
jgi:His/Glu/Gln/Arg/opine family amino acid ABC transporter permease subunit